MSTDLKYITYVASKVPQHEASMICDKLKEEFPIDIKSVDSIQEIFPLLSKPDYRVDFIATDVDDLYDVDGADVFDIIKTLSTLIHCTVYRPAKNIKPQKRNTKIVAIISENTSPELLKEILSVPEIDFLSLRYGPRIGYDSVKHAVLIMGYNDSTSAFLIKNSHGPDWGDGGYAWLPYDYVTNYVFERWCFDIANPGSSI